MKPTAHDYIRETYEESLSAKKAFIEQNVDQIVKACSLISQSIKKGQSADQ